MNEENTSGDTSGEISVDIATYYDVVEVLINQQTGTQRAVFIAFVRY